MKYIRTKDKIYKASLYLKEYTGWYINEKTQLYTFTEREIVNQADTIEELCDEFVAFKSSKDYGILDAQDYITGSKWEIEEYYNNGYQIYGAIWTDKGLIYVAKMNDKGELELL